jgi:hypothetical protein
MKSAYDKSMESTRQSLKKQGMQVLPSFSPCSESSKTDLIMALGLDSLTSRTLDKNGISVKTDERPVAREDEILASSQCVGQVCATLALLLL